MTAASILRSAIERTHLHVRFVLLDLIWKFLWLAVSTAATVVFGFGVAAQLGSIAMEGPDLGASNPILLLAALRQFWSVYGASILGGLGVLFLLVLVLWVALESLFRGGRKGFWIYLGSGVARMTILGAAALAIGALAARDESGGAYFIGGVVIFGLWFIVAIVETVVRRNAVELIATNLVTLSGVMAVFLLSEFVLAAALWGSTAAALLAASDESQFLVAIGLAALSGIFWLVAHSYMISARFWAVDIMRHNVVGS